MEKTAAILADELDKLAVELEKAAAVANTDSSAGDYLSGLVQGLGFNGATD